MTMTEESETLGDDPAGLEWPPPWLTEALQSVRGPAQDAEELDDLKALVVARPAYRMGKVVAWQRTGE
jgi:hypothetical protein